MKLPVVRTLLGLVGAAAIAIPVFAWADDESVKIKSRTETTIRASGVDTKPQQTVEGRLIDLHQYMTGTSASGAQGRVHQMWAIDSPTGLVLLSDPHSKPAPVAAKPTEKVVERKSETARTESRTGAKTRTEIYESETTVYGIERADLTASQNRVKAVGTLYSKGGLKYLVVSSIDPTASANKSQIKSEVKETIKIERDEDGDEEIEIEREKK